MTPTIPKNNSTISGMQSNTEKYLWTTYLTFVFLSSLFGDTIVLITFKFSKAIRLNPVIIVFIQHLATCDLLLCITWVLPIMISVIVEDWLLGNVLAQVQAAITFTYTMSTLLVCFLTTSKLLLVKYPLKTGLWTAKGTHIFCSLFWLALATYSLQRGIREKDKIFFDYSTYEIDFLHSDGNKVLSLMKGSLYLLITAIIILTSALTLSVLLKSRRVARRASACVRWQGILTVVLTATVFCISSLPYFVFYTAEPLMVERRPVIKRAAEYLSMLSITSNFFIYNLTIPSFRSFLTDKIRRMLKMLNVSCDVKRDVEIDTVSRN